MRSTFARALFVTNNWLKEAAVTRNPLVSATCRSVCALGMAIYGAGVGLAGQTPAAKDPLTIEPTEAVVCNGETVSFSAKRGSVLVPVTWNLDPHDRLAGDLQVVDEPPASLKPGQVVTSVHFVAPSPVVGDGDSYVSSVGTVILTARTPDGKDTATSTIELAGACNSPFGGEIARFTVGFEQIGAAGTDSSQRYGFDVFMSRPLPFGSRRRDSSSFYLGPRLRWWGDVRAGSYPQQVDSEVAKFANDFAANAGKVKVNQLVRSAEFETGVEVRVAASAEPRTAVTEGIRHRFLLTTFLGYGGIGPLPPVEGTTVFAVPDPAKPSPQLSAFQHAYPTAVGKYIAFVPPGFMQQWTVGARLYSFHAGNDGTARPLTAAPAIVELSLGKNQLVSPRDWVIHASGFYPLAFGDRTKPDTLVVYFYGDALMALRGRGTAAALYLPPAVDDKGNSIPLTDSNVTIVASPLNTRDTYRIGVAIDLMRLWKKLATPSQPGTAK
jgi:hypothetical protein